MPLTDERRLQLETLWRTDRGAFLAEYRRVVGESPGSGGSRMSLKAMIDRIIEREASEGRRRISAHNPQGGARHDG